MLELDAGAAVVVEMVHRARGAGGCWLVEPCAFLEVEWVLVLATRLIPKTQGPPVLVLCEWLLTKAVAPSKVAPGKWLLIGRRVLV